MQHSAILIEAPDRSGHRIRDTMGNRGKSRMNFNISSNTNAITIDWVELLAVATNIAIVFVALASLYIAIATLRHQRGHDNKIIEHERRQSEPYVIWSFGFDDDGFFEINLVNTGPGLARRIRSELSIHGKTIVDWNWKMVFDELGRGAELQVKDFKPTMPKSIEAGKTVKIVGIRSEQIDRNDFLRRLIGELEIRYYYKSVQNDRELVTEWATLESIGFRD